MGEVERPDCPYCGRELSVAPFSQGIGWKCPVDGTFPPSEFEANPLDALNETLENGGPSIFTAILVLLLMSPILIYEAIRSYFTP